MNTQSSAYPTTDDALPLAAELLVLETATPRISGALRGACRAVAAVVSPELLAFTRRRVEIVLGATDAILPEPASRLLASAAELIDQFLIYVPAVTEEILAPLRTELGEDGLVAFVQALYVIDQTTRLRLIYAQLFGEDRVHPGPTAENGPVLSPEAALANLHAETMLLSGLETLTTEIVRLRAGSYHRCRLCTSIRLQDRGESVVNEGLAAKIERGDVSGLSVKDQLALQYADAHMVDPRAIDTDLIAALGQHFSRAQTIELTLDVSQWNQQKILVALGTDDPVSEAGLTPLMFDDGGHIVHGTHGSLG
jgi:alkylhydroperoxidase family enzyme